MTPARFAVLAAVISAARQEELEEALGATGFTAWALASRLDGDLDLALYPDQAGLPAEVAAALAVLGIVPQTAGGGTAEELVRGFLPDQPSELCPGVWIDPCGALADQPGRTVLRLAPSLAFGDGHHPSTRMAAGYIASLPLTGAAALDLGCGTGVLGLLALLRGAASCDFTDIDPAALAATRAALAAHGRNGRVYAADLLDGVGGPYRLVIANLYADLVLDLLADPRLAAALPRGWLVLAGIHARHRGAVRTALAAAGFAVDVEGEEAWWCAFLAHR